MFSATLYKIGVRCTPLQFPGINAEPRLNNGQILCRRHHSGQHPSLRSRLHKIVKGTAMHFAIFFKIDAGILSGPVAFDSSKASRSCNVWRDCKAVKSSYSMSGRQKNWQSTTSSDRRALVSKIVAKSSDLAFGSFIHSLLSRRGEIDEHFVFFSSNSRFSRHQILFLFSIL